MESKPIESENKGEGDEEQLSPSQPQQQQDWLKKQSPLVFLKKRVKSGSGKKRRDSGHSDGDCEPVHTIDEERNEVNNSPSVDSPSLANRRLSLDSAGQPQSLPNKEKPRRGIAKVFHDLKHRSRVRKSHSAPPTAMDQQVSSPVSVLADDDSFSSYATPMEAHSSGYSTPLFESNMASPETSLSESFIEEDEEQADDTTTVVESNNSPIQQVGASVQSPTLASASTETLTVLNPKVDAPETEPIHVVAETVESSKPDKEEETEKQIEAITSLATSTPTEASTSGQRSRIPLLSQHRASVPSTSQEIASDKKSLADPSRSSSTNEIRFCFSEYVNGESPSRGFIRSLPPPSDPKMDNNSHVAGIDSNGYPKNEHLYKVLVIGELGTGKTSIIKRYVHQFFSQHYRATIGVDFALKVVHWDQSTVIRLQLWDIAGQERFGNMTRVYYKEAVGAFIVFDVTRSSTFESVAKWKQDLDTKVQLPDGSPIPCVLLANKCDQPKEGIAASAAKLDEYCKEKGFAGWFETSAKDNINIDDAAKFLVGTILQNDQWSTSVKEDDADKLELNGKGGNAVGDKKKGGCC